MLKGYYRQPAVFNDQVIFVSEDDLWQVSTTGGVARRLTATKGLISRPCFSNDGQLISYSSFEEGALEVYVMPANGGDSKRLTYLAATSEVFGWTAGGEVLFRSSAINAMRTPELLKVNPATLVVTSLGLGPGTSLAINPDGSAVMERNSNRPDPAHWKRYRGGTAGQLWTAPSVDGEFKRILENINGNYSSPQWCGERIYFISDHEGWGNVYSCTADGLEIRRHTSHDKYYARNLKSDGRTFVYHSGADIFHFDPATQKSQKLEITCQSQRSQRQRHFTSVTKNWEGVDISPKGGRVAFGTRGQVFAFGNWQGPVFKKGDVESVRYRLAHWLSEETLVLVCDQDGKDRLEFFKFGETKNFKVIAADFGQVLALEVSPDGKFIALGNHRNELIVIDVEKEKTKTVSQNKFEITRGQFCWSPDSQWVAFSHNLDKNRKQIQVYNTEDHSVRALTRDGLHFSHPVFDPNGDYLYFVGAEMLNPVYSDIMFDVFLPKSHVPCVVSLRKDVQGPFLRKFDDEAAPEPGKSETKTPLPMKVQIDFENIEARMQSFPVNEGLVWKLVPARDRKLYYLSNPSEGTLGNDFWASGAEAKTTVKVYDFKNRKEEDYLSGITNFSLSPDGQNQCVRVKNSVYVGKSGEKPKLELLDKEFNAKSGWIDFNRVKLMIDPAKEWRQMFGEIWRLQRDYFWVENMSQIQWQNAFNVYEPLLDRVSTRSEFSDLAWELQGELGTSHAYEIGGDTKPYPNYPVGSLGADFKWTGKAYEVEKVYDGEISRADKMSPLLQPGVQAQVGDQLLSIDGLELSANVPPGLALLHKAGSEVEIRLRRKSGDVHTYWVKALSNDKENRYRDWVETNRKYVHEKSGGKLGYVHIPDMGPPGYAEFFRNYLREFEFEGLVVDARYNGGGHVSQLILDYLGRKRLGYDKTRWTGTDPYPSYSPSGPIVALTNQYAGSDGDIFPHAFKLMKLGPVIGQRTWGGVIGIYPRNFLADGGITTQPEFSFWFKDVGWGVENYGTEPDILVDIAPHEFKRGQDPQLDRGIREALALSKKEPPLKPDWQAFPDLSQPRELT